MQVFSQVSDRTQKETAIQMAIMDAMSKGCTSKYSLIGYMETPDFDAAVERYLKMMKPTTSPA